MFCTIFDVPIIFEDDILELVERLKNLNALIKLNNKILKLHRKRLRWLTQQLFEAEFLLTAEELSQLSTYSLFKQRRIDCVAELRSTLADISIAKSYIRSLPINRIRAFLNVH